MELFAYLRNASAYANFSQTICFLAELSFLAQIALKVGHDTVRISFLILRMPFFFLLSSFCKELGKFCPSLRKKLNISQRQNVEHFQLGSVK